MSSTVKPGSQNSRILAVLQDGHPHSTAEIHYRAGYSRLNSRIAELRKQGHRIVCNHLDGKTGPEGYTYQLLESQEQAA